MRVECDEMIGGMLSGPAGHVHLMGVCGVGVAGMARLMAAHGWRVSGCDASAGSLAGWLADAGIRVQTAHDESHIDNLLAQAGGGPALLVRSAAVPDDHPEVKHARRLGVRVVRRGELLAAWVSSTLSVAICGTHGKTTTTCFTTRLLQELGAAPTWCIGGMTATLGGVAGVGVAGGPTVVEADESDGTLAGYRPSVTVMTNIDLDHLDHFSGETELTACFESVVRSTRSGVAFGADDERARGVAAGHPGFGFGFDEGADLRAVDPVMEADRVAFTVVWRGASLGRVVLPVPGRHNVLNALGAMSAAMLLGYEPADCLACLPKAAELPGRRFERVATAGSGIDVVSDYAHHPAEIAALMATARLQGARRILAVFQPHRFSRTKALASDFPAAFDGVDELALTPVYAAAENAVDGGRIMDLYASFRARRPMGKVLLAPSLNEAWAYLRRVLRAGDLLLVVGAGDVLAIAEWAREAGERIGADAAMDPIPGAHIEPGGSLAAWTLYGVGGAADWRVEVDTPDALARVRRWAAARKVPFQIVGGGANMLVSDTGVAGVVARMRGEAFRSFVRQGASVEIGCGWHGPALLDRLEREGLSGLEFLDGVPGQVGGWLAMNAGAHGGEIGRHVVWIRCLNSDGTESIVNSDQADFGYRRCNGLMGRVALAARLKLVERASAEVKLLREGFRRRRISLAGMRTAGSVFRNPADGSAGRLLDAAGCKGMRIGGAVVTEQHANVVACGSGATASDLLALVAEMRGRVGRRTGVWLEPEIRILGLTATDMAFVDME